MRDLRLIGVHEDGHHLLLASADGDRFRVPLDEALRAAARRERPQLGQPQREVDGGLRPRDVQSMIRAGASAEEVAERAGWSVEKVRKYEGPILAEREHVARLARQVRVRTRGSQHGGSVPTLSARVAQRMHERGVDPEANAWDAWRSAEGHQWTVVLTFAAGGRQRQASWKFDPVSRTVDAGDDEARWLSEEEPSDTGLLGGNPTSGSRVPARATSVYDVEAEGGVTASAAPRARADEPVDLMTAMRQRSGVGGRRTGSRRRPTPTELPGGDPPADALPLAELRYDPVVDGLPPPAHVHPHDDRLAAGEGAAAEGGAVQPAAEGEQRMEAGVSEPEGAVSEPEGAVSEPEGAVGEPEGAVGEPEIAEREPPEPGGTEAEATPHRGAGGRRRPGARRPVRASVPSWDDVMFGTPRD